jgi:hypothetical protein
LVGSEQTKPDMKSMQEERDVSRESETEALGDAKRKR